MSVIQRIARLNLCCHVHAGLHNGTREPIKTRPQSMLEARDLPRCHLSDFLESRLQKTLQLDRELRARKQGLPPEQARSTLCPGYSFNVLGVDKKSE